MKRYRRLCVKCGLIRATCAEGLCPFCQKEKFDDDRKSTEYLSGVPYKMRLEDLQRRYLGIHKKLNRRGRRGPVNCTPDSEAARVYREGRF